METYAEVLTQSGEDAKAMVRAMVLADEFRIARVVPEDPANPTEAEIEVAEAFGVLKARPPVLGRAIEDLTGFSWVVDLTPFGGGEELNLGLVPMMEDSFLGYRVLAGGIDSQYVAEPSHTYNGTAYLVLDALAREAAHFAVERDLAAATGRPGVVYRGRAERRRRGGGAQPARCVPPSLLRGAGRT